VTPRGRRIPRRLAAVPVVGDGVPLVGDPVSTISGDVSLVRQPITLIGGAPSLLPSALPLGRPRSPLLFGLGAADPSASAVRR
jgi:hypothetical protein